MIPEFIANQKGHMVNGNVNHISNIKKMTALDKKKNS